MNLKKKKKGINALQAIFEWYNSALSKIFFFPIFIHDEMSWSHCFLSKEVLKQLLP